MAKNYKQHIQELKKADVVPKSGNFHDYEAFPIEEVFEMFYQLSQDYLDRVDNEIDLRPGKFYYTDNGNVNACAWKHDDTTYIIEMCQGTMRLMFNFFTSLDSKFDEPELKKFKDVIHKRGIDPGYFLFQLITSYFLYHEAGHLIQRTQGDIDYEENPEGRLSNEQVPKRHIRELDADWFSAHCMAMIVKQFSEGEADGGKKIDPDDLFLISSLALAAIYSYYIKLNTIEPNLYYNENSHPHPSVRLSYIIIFFLQNLAANVEADMDQKEILTEAIKTSQQLLKTDESDIIEFYSKELYENMDQVEQYINQIISESDSYPYLSKKAFEAAQGR